MKGSKEDYSMMGGCKVEKKGSSPCKESRRRCSSSMASRKVSFFHGFQEIKKAFLDFKVSSPFVRARALDHGEKVSQDHEIKKGFLDCQKERRVLLIWGFLDWFLNCSRKGSRNSRKGSLCMNLDL